MYDNADDMIWHGLNEPLLLSIAETSSSGKFAECMTFCSHTRQRSDDGSITLIYGLSTVDRIHDSQKFEQVELKPGAKIFANVLFNFYSKYTHLTLYI